MKKISLLFFLVSCSFIVIFSANAWESNIKIECINENLEPCSPLDVTSNKSNENSDIDLDKPLENKKKVVKKKEKKRKKEKVVKKKTKKKKKEKIVKKKKGKKEKIKVAKVKSKNISFEEFKNLVINYTNSSGYPNIDN